MRTLIAEDYDPKTGFTERWYRNSADGKIIYQVLQDVEPNLIQNTKEFNSHSSKARFNKREGLGRKVASIPMAIIEKWRMEGFDIFKATPAEIKRRLNDNEFSKLRTAPGKL